MKLLLASLLVLLSLNFAQAAEPVFPSGSTVGLVPPPGMSLATGFSGFEDEAHGAKIVVTTFPPIAYKQLVPGFADRLKQQGTIVDEHVALTVGGNPALLISGRQQVSTPQGKVTVRARYIIVGSPKGSAFVIADVVDAESATFPDAVIRTALTSVTFRDPPSLGQQADALPFTLSLTAHFRITGTMAGNTVVLTDGPKDVDPEEDQPSFIVVSSNKTPAVAARANFARQTLGTGGDSYRVTSIETARNITIGGFPAYEILASGRTKSGASIKIVDWELFAPNSTITMEGIARTSQFDGIYPELVALRDSIRPK